jgi:hypothetical protein
MKKFLILLATLALPFLLVWAGWFLTAFSYHPRLVFQSGSFWGVSVLYWFLWICVLGMIVEIIDESVK